MLTSFLRAALTESSSSASCAACIWTWKYHKSQRGEMHIHTNQFLRFSIFNIHPCSHIFANIPWQRWTPALHSAHGTLTSGASRSHATTWEQRASENTQPWTFPWPHRIRAQTAPLRGVIFNGFNDNNKMHIFMTAITRIRVRTAPLRGVIFNGFNDNNNKMYIFMMTIIRGIWVWIATLWWVIW